MDEVLVLLDRKKYFVLLDGVGLATGWLVIFDRRGGQVPIAQRTTVSVTMSPVGRPIEVIRA